MKSFLVLCLLLVLAAHNLFAQAPTPPDAAVISDTVKLIPWKVGATANFNFAQSGVHNWLSGGQNAIGINNVFALLAHYKSGKYRWQNNLDFTYGTLRQEEIGEFRKTDDQIIAISTLIREITGRLAASAMLDFRSQIATGYKYNTNDSTGIETRRLISRWMAPGYLMPSLGAELSFEDEYSIRLAPLAGKLTFVMDDELSAAGAYGVDPGETIRTELGMQFNAAVQGEVMKNMVAKSRILLFSNYETFGNVDVNWEGTILMKVNKYVTTSLTAALIYDDDIDITREDGTVGQDIQFRQGIQVGLSIVLIDKDKK